MDMPKHLFHMNSMAQTDVYTNLQGLNSIKNEENQDEALKKVAQQFESMFVSMMLKNMRAANAVFEEGSMFNSNESKFFRDMLDHQRSLTLSNGQGVGIADVMYQQMSRQYTEQVTNQSLKTDYPIDSPVDIKPVEKRSDNSDIQFESPEDFVRKILPFAEKAAAEIGVDPETLVAQTALETGWGKYLVQGAEGDQSRNFFNIKVGNNWDGGAVEKPVLEFLNGTFTTQTSKFRQYDSIQESFDDYVDFVKENPRYRNALENAADGQNYIQELKNSGYATDPQYVEKVMDVRSRVQITKEKLAVSDQVGNGGRVL